MTEKPKFVLHLEVPPNQTQGNKEPVTFLFRYWFGPGDSTYIETIGSDGKSYGFEGEHMTPLDISGHESIEQRSSSFRGQPPQTNTKFFLSILAILLVVLAVLLSLMSFIIGGA